MTRTYRLAVVLLVSLCTAVALAAEPTAEEILSAAPNADSYGKHLLILTEEPHMAGTERNHALAEYVRDRFREYGLDDVSFHEFPALLSYGKSAALAIRTPVEQAFDLPEDPYPADKDSRLYDDPANVAFHGYAPSGKVRAEVVYANGGSPEDFQLLDRMGIDLKGKIVLMRYSNPYSYRGYKVYEAERRGAAGTIIYSDPAEDGSRLGPVYPDGPWGPDSHIQWGAILYDWLGQGEPFTFHWKQQPDGRWVEGAERDKQLPRIPSMPLNERNAAAILKQMGGPEAPADWQGGLPITYRIGPGPVTLDMDVQNEERIGTLRSVIGVIRGREEPDKLVILGNHLDAWIYGAVDPSSGTAALLETARAFGEALKQGHRPRRTIVFAVWDGEEPLLGGLDAMDAQERRAAAPERGDLHQRRQRREWRRLHRRRDARARWLPARRHEGRCRSRDREEAAFRGLGLALRGPRAGGRDDRRRDRLHGVPGVRRRLLHRHVLRRSVRRVPLDVRRLLPPEHGGRSGLCDRHRACAALGRPGLAARRRRSAADALLGLRARGRRLHRGGRRACGL